MLSCREFKKGKNKGEKTKTNDKERDECKGHGRQSQGDCRLKERDITELQNFTQTGSGKVNAEVSSTEELWVMGGGEVLM